MQTFLAYPDFKKSMEVLDPKRLGNQVYREGITLLRGNWPNHPASKMWQGYYPALAAYLWAGVEELERRGKDYAERPWWWEIIEHYEENPKMPEWLGDERLHSSHRSALLFKDYKWYSQFNWSEEPIGPKTPGSKWPYYWPSASLAQQA